jgi:hypothetical protein
VDTLRWEFDPATLAPLGAAFAGARTNYLLWARDLTQTAWGKVNASVALTATGAEGTPNAASIITASAADAWVAQYGSGSSAGVHGISIMARRRTGTGDVRFARGQITGGAGVGPILLSNVFDAATGWTLGSGWTISGGKLVATGVTSGVATISLPASMLSGHAYEVTYTIDSISGGQVRARFEGTGPTDLTNRSAPGTYSQAARRDTTHTTLRFIASGGTVTAAIDNLSIRPYMQAPTTLTANWQRFDLGVETTGANRPNPALGIYLATSGDEIDVDFAQGEAGPFTSAVIPASTVTAGTRAQGNVSIPVAQLGARLSRRQGLIILDWNSQPGPFTSALDAEWFGLVSWGDTTADNRLGILINPAHTSLQARVTAGGAVQTASAATISAPSAGLTTRAAVAWDLDAGFLQVAGRGVAGSKVALTALPLTLTHLMPGRYATSNPGFIRVQGIEVRSAALFDSALAALT